jgi:hypothetical protein
VLKELVKDDERALKKVLSTPSLGITALKSACTEG